MLEKMRVYYSLSQSQEATNGSSIRLEEDISANHLNSDSSTDTGNKGENYSRKEDDYKPSYFNNSLDLIKLFGSFTSRTSSSSDVESRLIVFIAIKLYARCTKTCLPMQ